VHACLLPGAEVADGDVTVKISWAGMEVAQQQQSLCKFLSCPIKAGPITATYENTMPSFVPRVSQSSCTLHHLQLLQRFFAGSLSQALTGQLYDTPCTAQDACTCR
jgi:hypothetical protein